MIDKLTIFLSYSHNFALTYTCPHYNVNTYFDSMRLVALICILFTPYTYEERIILCKDIETR